MSKRTIKQIEANRLDLETFRLASQVERFAENHKENGLHNARAMLLSLRYEIRRHMHKEDREKT